MPGIHRFLGFYLLIGLIQGIVFNYSDQLYRLSETLFFVTYTLALVGGTTLQLLGEKVRHWRSLLPTLVFTLLMGGMTLWVCYGVEHIGDNRWAINSWFISVVVLSYVCASFLFAWPSAKGQRWRYEDLFQQAWNSVFIVLYALILVGLFMALLKLWSRLFLMLGIEFFERHFWSELFLCFALPLVFALGMYLAARSEKVIGQMRSMLLSACGLLLPLIALLISHDAIVGEMERGTMLLLLTYPLSRWQVVLGKFLGHVAILGGATLIGYGAAAVALAAAGEALNLLQLRGVAVGVARGVCQRRVQFQPQPRLPGEGVGQVAGGGAAPPHQGRAAGGQRYREPGVERAVEQAPSAQGQGHGEQPQAGGGAGKGGGGFQGVGEGQQDEDHLQPHAADDQPLAAGGLGQPGSVEVARVAEEDKQPRGQGGEDDVVGGQRNLAPPDEEREQSGDDREVNDLDQQGGGDVGRAGGMRGQGEGVGMTGHGERSLGT